MAVGILVTYTGRSPGSSNPRAAANMAVPWSTDTLGGSPSRHDKPPRRPSSRPLDRAVANRLQRASVVRFTVAGTAPDWPWRRTERRSWTPSVSQYAPQRHWRSLFISPGRGPARTCDVCKRTNLKRTSNVDARRGQAQSLHGIFRVRAQGANGVTDRGGGGPVSRCALCRAGGGLRRGGAQGGRGPSRPGRRAHRTRRDPRSKPRW